MKFIIVNSNKNPVQANLIKLKDLTRKYAVILVINQGKLNDYFPTLQFLRKDRSSRPEVFCKKDLENFTKFTGKHLCQSLFFNKVAAPKSFFYRTPLVAASENNFLIHLD